MHPKTRARFSDLFAELKARGYNPSAKPATATQTPPMQLVLGEKPKPAPERATVALGLAALRETSEPLRRKMDAMIACLSEPERAIVEARIGPMRPTAFPQTAARAAKVLDELGVTPAVALERYHPKGDADPALVPTLDERLAVLTRDERDVYDRRMREGA